MFRINYRLIPFFTKSVSSTPISQTTRSGIRFFTTRAPVNIVFDIDSTLGERGVGSEAIRLTNHPNWHANLGCFHRVRAQWVYFYPGVTELMQALFDKVYITVSFFSSGVAEENKAFVSSLLTRSLGDMSSDPISKTVILSREDCIDAQYRPKLQPKIKGFWGNRKKDLRSVLEKTGGLLPDTLLVEDDLSYTCTNEQVQNLIKVRYTEFSYLTTLKDALHGGDQYADRKETFVALNKIFYIAGLLNELGVFQDTKHNANHTPKSLVDRLATLQAPYMKQEDTFNPQGQYIPDYEQLYQELSIYKTGLDILNKYNPQLKLIVQHETPQLTH